MIKNTVKATIQLKSELWEYMLYFWISMAICLHMILSQNIACWGADLIYKVAILPAHWGNSFVEIRQSHDSLISTQLGFLYYTGKTTYLHRNRVLMLYAWIPFLLSWFNFNPSMDKYNHMPSKVGWDYLSIPKLQRFHRWSLGMDKWYHPTSYGGFMLGFKLNHVSKRGRWQRQTVLFIRLYAPCQSFFTYLFLWICIRWSENIIQDEWGYLVINHSTSKISVDIQRKRF